MVSLVGSLGGSPAVTVGSEQARNSLRDSSLIRVLKADLEGIHRVLNSSGLSDDMTNCIRQWHQSFSTCLRIQSNNQRQLERNPQNILEEFIVQLQRLLVDPLSKNSPLDLNPRLGSDGRTYSSHTLDLYYRSVREELRNRCPMNPGSAASFTTQIHPVVRELQSFLQRRERLLPSPKVPVIDHPMFKESERIFLESERKRAAEREEEKAAPQATISARSLFTEWAAATPAVSTVSKVQQILALQAERRLRQEGNLREHQERVVAEVRQEFAGQVERVSAHIERRAEEIARRSMARLTEIERQFAAELAQIDLDIAQQEQNLEILVKENQELAAGRRIVSTLIGDLERENLEVEKALSDCKVAIEQKRVSNKKATRNALGIIGICAFVTWAISSFVFPPAGGITGSLLPLNGGGGMLKLSFAL